LENLEDLSRKGLAFQQASKALLSSKSSYSLKNSVVNSHALIFDGGLKFGHFGILDTLFPILAFFKL